jgi:HEPN domain
VGWAIQEPPRNATLAINAAKSFHGLAGIFFEQLIKSDAPETLLTEHKGSLVAASTNLAFAVELYLKATAIATAGRAKKTHDLVKLFRDLPKDVSDSIERCYRYRFANRADRRDLLVEFWIAIAEEEIPVSERDRYRVNKLGGEDVTSLLMTERKAFETWRYVFGVRLDEGRPMCIQFHYFRMLFLINAIQDQIGWPGKSDHSVLELASGADGTGAAR